MRVIALVMADMALTTHAAGPAYVWCRSSTIAKIRRQLSVDSQAPGHPTKSAALADGQRLEPDLDAGCLGSTGVATSRWRAMSRDAIAYAWLLNDASADLVAEGAGNDAPRYESGSPTCLDMPQPMLGDDTCARTGLPRNLGAAVTANAQQFGARCVDSSYKLANIGIWSAHRIESVAYTRHPACPYDARPRSTERGCVHWLRRTSFRHASYVRERRKADVRRAVVHVLATARPCSCWCGITSRKRSVGFRGPNSLRSAIRVSHAKCDRPLSAPAARPCVDGRRSGLLAGPPIRSSRRSTCCETVSRCWPRATARIFEGRLLTSSQVGHGGRCSPIFQRPATYPRRAQRSSLTEKIVILSVKWRSMATRC